MKRKWMLVPLALALVVAMTATASAASPTLYIGDTKDYAVAFKAEEAQLYVIELAGTTDCYYTEPHEDAGHGGFSAFPAPKLMRGEGTESLGAEDFGEGNARISGKLEGDVVSGEYSYAESEESFHCDTGFTPSPFQASRYQPAESGGIRRSGERPVYYGSEASTEVFLRAAEKEAFGIRGTFVPQCRVRRGKRIVARYPLFSEPVNVKLGEGSSFEVKDSEQGVMRTRARFRETISLTGSVDREAVVTGTYLRVRTIKPRRKAKRRCVTGPLAFHAVRYLPAG